MVLNHVIPVAVAEEPLPFLTKVSEDTYAGWIESLKGTQGQALAAEQLEVLDSMISTMVKDLEASASSAEPDAMGNDGLDSERQVIEALTAVRLSHIMMLGITTNGK